jgi:branched-chain amino acid transport system permease protein
VIGAAVLSALPEVLRPVKEYSDVIYTLILLGFLILMPRGLVTVWHRAMRRVRGAGAAPAVEGIRP